MGYLASRSVLDILNRVMRETGLPEVSAITSKQAKIALESLNDAFADIWQRHRWTFQRYTAALAMVDSQQDYSLPADFDRMASNFRVRSLPLEELSPEQWWAAGYGGITSYGQPYVYTVDSLTARFYPIPDAGFVANSPTISFQYFKAMPSRRVAADINSSWDLPLDFEDAQVRFGKSRLKQFLEYPDYRDDMQSYEQALRVLFNKYREVRVAPRFHITDVPQSW